MATTAEKGEALVLEHFGVKGMKWGVRKDESSSTPTKKKGPSTDAQKAQAAQAKAKKHGEASLSNAEMKHLVNRMNLEQQYETLNYKNRSLKQKGYDFAKEVVIDTGKSVVKTQAKNAMNHLVGEALAEVIGKPGTVKGDAKAEAKEAARKQAKYDRERERTRKKMEEGGSGI